MSERRRIVIKVGSSTLTNGLGAVDDRFLAALAVQVATLKERGKEVIVVSSGAIAAGLAKLGIEQRPSEMSSLQAAASVGSLALAHAYDIHFSIQGLTVSQVLLTKNDIASSESYAFAKATFERLLELGVVPIVNENDTVAVDEIRFGDNDTLAAQVGLMVDADLVILLSDIEGFYDSNPQNSADARLVDCVSEVTPEMIDAAGGAGTTNGSGGMITKLQAAQTLLDAGIAMSICHGRHKDVILDIVEGNPVGTLFENVAKDEQTDVSVPVDRSEKAAATKH